MLTSDSIEQFHDWSVARGKSKNTARAYRADLTQLQAWLEDQGLDPSTAEHFEDAVAAYLTVHRDEWAASTTRRKASAFRAYARWANIDGFLNDYKLPPPPPSQPHPLPEGIPGVLALIEGTRTHRYRAIIALCGLCGLRVGEVLKLDKTQIRSNPDGRWYVHVIGKGGRQRYVPIHPKVWDFIAPHYGRVPEGRLFAIGERRVRHKITELGVKVFGRPIASHDLRMTAGTAFYRTSGNDLRATQIFLGHANSSTTERYTFVDEDAILAGSNFFKEKGLR